MQNGLFHLQPDRDSVDCNDYQTSRRYSPLEEGLVVKQAFDDKYLVTRNGAGVRTLIDDGNSRYMSGLAFKGIITRHCLVDVDVVIQSFVTVQSIETIYTNLTRLLEACLNHAQLPGAQLDGLVRLVGLLDPQIASLCPWTTDPDQLWQASSMDELLDVLHELDNPTMAVNGASHRTADFGVFRAVFQYWDHHANCPRQSVGRVEAEQLAHANWVRLEQGWAAPGPDFIDQAIVPTHPILIGNEDHWSNRQLVVTENGPFIVPMIYRNAFCPSEARFNIDDGRDVIWPMMTDGQWTLPHKSRWLYKVLLLQIKSWSISSF